MNKEQFMKELDGVERDAIREGIEDHVFPYLGIDDIKRAMLTLREHAHGFGDLFEHTEPPTDEALLMVFAFLVLP